MAVIIPQVVTEDRAGGAKILGGSLRFNSGSSHYLNRTPASAGNRKTMTFSFWVKRSLISSTQQNIFSAGTSSDNYIAWSLTNDYIEMNFRNGGSASNVFLITTPVFRDISAWYHIVLAIDTTQATAANRAKLYVNGVQITAFGTTNYPTQNNDLNSFGNNVIQYIGQTGVGGFNYYLNGYLTEFHHIDGYAYDSSYFGFTDPLTNTWRPKKYTGEYGTNGFYLPLDDDNAKGTDRSGKGNNWTANNFTGTSTSPDVVPDSPSGISYSTVPTVGIGTTTGLTKPNNYCTLNATVGTTSDGKATLSDGNLVCTVPRLCSIDSTFGVTSGKYYWEVTATNLTNGPYGMGIFATGHGIIHGSTNYLILSSTGSLYTPGDSNNQGNGWGPTYNGSTDVIGLALNMNNYTLGFNKNGGSFTTYDFSAYTSTYKMADVTPCWKSGGNLGTSGATFNFGQRPFRYTPPTGFLPLCTANLPRPTIVRPDKFFGIVTYNSAQTISGLGFSPDLIWHKSRNQGYNHYLYDSVRGVGAKGLNSSTTTAEGANDTLGILSFDKDGFSFSSDAGLSQTDAVAWCWKAGGKSNTYNINDIGYSTAAAAGLTAGTITPTGASVNTKSGFSIVTYTGIAGDNISATVGHGLGVAPKLIIIKNRDWASSAAAWQTYHASLPSTGTSPVRLSQSLSLDTTSEASGNDFKDQMNNTLPTSTVFSVSSHDGVSAANRYRTYGRADKYVAYCWSEIAGFSKFGSYTGNGSTDGPFVFCGFRPRWIMIKRSDSTGDWFVFDTARDTSNVSYKWLKPNTSGTEPTSTGDNWDILSNGFKPRNLNGNQNASGGTYIFAAYAESPTQNLFGGQSSAR